MLRFESFPPRLDKVKLTDSAIATAQALHALEDKVTQRELFGQMGRAIDSMLFANFTDGAFDVEEAADEIFGSYSEFAHDAFFFGILDGAYAEEHGAILGEYDPITEGIKI